MWRSILNRWWILLAAASALVACSRPAVVYENADWLTYRWAVGYVDATDAQRDRWRGRFDGLLAAHREQLVPRITTLLQQLERNASIGLHARSLNCLLDHTDDLYQAHARLVVPLAVDILSELSPDQQAHLSGRIAERDAEYVEEYLPDDAEERHERWTGRLNREQREMVAAEIATMPDTTEPWLDYRRQQQQRLLTLLQEGATKQRLAEFLASWWVDFADRPADLVAATDELRRRSVALTLKVDATLAPDQRTHFVEEVSDLRAGLSGALTTAVRQPAAMIDRCG